MTAMVYAVYTYLQSIDKNIAEDFKNAAGLQKGILKEFKRNSSLFDKAHKLALANRKDGATQRGKIYALKSIFNSITGNKNADGESKFMNLDILRLEKNSLFPTSSRCIDRDKFLLHIRKCVAELKKLSNPIQIYYIIQKYFCNLPAVNENECEISLFNVAKLTSALSMCLLRDENKFIIVKGDISGIQDFVFKVPNKGASKTLKGRSVYISLLTDIVSKYIVDELGFSLTNIIYNGGGNFYVLASGKDFAALEKIRRYISEKLLEFYQGDIYIAIGIKDFNMADLFVFNHTWEKVSRETGKIKARKWSEIGLKENRQKIFGPIQDGYAGESICTVCKNSFNGVDETHLCSLCKSFIELTDSLKNAKIYQEKRIEKKVQDVDLIGNRRCLDLFNAFGYEVGFSKETNEDFLNYLINNTDFIDSDCCGYIFKSINLPEGDFEKIAEHGNSDGDKKLGVVKLDVDNLGKIFITGLENEYSIASMMELSRLFTVYFEGYVNKFIERIRTNGSVAEKIYIVFAGGDDTFLIGAYNYIFEFAYNFRENFRQYVCGNPNVTFSAGLLIFDPKYPVSRICEYAEHSLEMAKNYTEENRVVKDRVAFFGEVFSWHEFREIMRIRDKCVELVRLSNKRGVLNKVLKSTKGFKSIMEDSQSKRKLHLLKMHRLAYYLREIRAKNSETREKVEELIKIYEDIVFTNLLNTRQESGIKNIMLIPSAVRWAELNTRKV